MLINILTVTYLAASAVAHAGDHEHQVPIAGPHKALWYNTMKYNALPGDGGTQVCQLGPDGFSCAHY
jgi:agmatinase